MFAHTVSILIAYRLERDTKTAELAIHDTGLISIRLKSIAIPLQNTE